MKTLAFTCLKGWVGISWNDSVTLLEQINKVTCPLPWINAYSAARSKFQQFLLPSQIQKRWEAYCFPLAFIQSQPMEWKSTTPLDIEVSHPAGTLVPSIVPGMSLTWVPHPQVEEGMGTHKHYGGEAFPHSGFLVCGGVACYYLRALVWALHCTHAKGCCPLLTQIEMDTWFFSLRSQKCLDV